MPKNRPSSADGPAAQVPLGFGELTAQPGTHIAHFYQSRQEWRDVLVAYHKAGLEAGDKCVYLMKSPQRQEWLTALSATGVDVGRALDAGQLVVLEGIDTALERQTALAGTLAELGTNFPRLRSGGDVNWTDTHWEWETHIDNQADEAPAVFLCQYDLKTLGGDVVINALNTHPVCIVSGAIHRNPYYVEPDVFMKTLGENKQSVRDS